MSDILVALGNVFTIGNLAGLIFGTGAGILIGAMPGLSVNMGIALLFPLTFAFQGVGGILMLLFRNSSRSMQEIKFILMRFILSPSHSTVNGVPVEPLVLRR